jgi:formamidopyrimidine-DNA glycosylase
MPELPEVETTVKILNGVLPGLTICGVWSDFKKIVKKPKSFERFKDEIVGKKILAVKRVGKNILINLSDNRTLLVHQKLTGHLLYGRWKFNSGEWKSEIKGPLSSDSKNRFLHFVLELSNRNQLALSDPRKFAKVLVWPTDKLNKLDDLKKIGPNPLARSFTLDVFKMIISGHKGKIRDLLMDQQIISGIGNIYSTEILWEAGVHPFKQVNKLSGNEIKAIYVALKKILTRAVKLKGDSMVDYRDPFGQKGRYQEFHRAYQKEGQKCFKKDGGVIKRVKERGRSVFYCPIHQK